ncbi:MAG TPA: hypothetical protein VNK67_03580 [Burkholderiales bacterium]|nr:hypothetical protein [Burkholderiales bacterium]
MELLVVQIPSGCLSTSELDALLSVERIRLAPDDPYPITVVAEAVLNNLAQPHPACDPRTFAEGSSQRAADGLGHADSCWYRTDDDFLHQRHASTRSGIGSSLHAGPFRFEDGWVFAAMGV